MPSPNDDLRATLDEYLEVEVPVQPGDFPEEAPVTAAPDEEFANRLLYKGRRLTEELANIKALADEERARIAAWEADMSGGIQRELGRLRQSLELFARIWHRDHPHSGKTLKLANGTLKLTAGRTKTVITDEQKLIAWASVHAPQLLRMEPAVAKSNLTDELMVTRHAGPQQTIDGDTLADTWRLMVPVAVEGQDEPELTTIPGVVLAKPVQDSFGMEVGK